MDYTNRYQLPQWVRSDRILMDDFNNAMAAIENGMSANAAAASEAKSEAISAKSHANAAKTIANTAKTTADTALEKARCLSIGSYVGDGSPVHQIRFTFSPKFIIISGMNSVTEPDEAANQLRYFYMGGKNKILYQLQLEEENGFTVYTDPSRTRYPILNEKGRTYEYIAFR